MGKITIKKIDEIQDENKYFTCGNFTPKCQYLACGLWLSGCWAKCVLFGNEVKLLMKLRIAWCDMIDE